MKQLQGVEQHASTMWWLNIFAGNLWTAETRAGVLHSPSVGQHGSSTPWDFHLPTLLQTEPRNKQGRHHRHGCSSAMQAFHYLWKFTFLYICCPLPMHLDCKWIQAETVFCWRSSTLDNRTVAIGEVLEWYLKAEVYIQCFWAWTNFSKNVITQTYNLPFVMFNLIPRFQAQLEAIPVHCHLTEKGWSCTRCYYPHSAMDTSFPTSTPLLLSVWINKAVI